MGKKEDLTIIKKFASKVRKEMPVEEIILFGSRAKGDNKKDSDFDFVIVSKKFAWLNFFERSKKMYKYWEEHIPVDFMCYTPEEYALLKKRVSIVREAFRTGIVFKEN